MNQSSDTTTYGGRWVPWNPKDVYL